MAIKKQTIVFSVVFDDEETYAGSAAEAISRRLYNEDGIEDWDFKVKREEIISLSAEVTEEDLEGE